MRILYAATDSIAVPLLEYLAERGLVAAVFTNPDAPGKRGKTLIPTPVKAKALELGLPVYTPEHLGSAERKIVTEEIKPDFLLSFCYGKIFGPKFLALFPRAMNVHPSPLPLYRGCSPIQATIRDGRREGCISLQEIALGIDEGRIYAQQPFLLDGTEDVLEMERKVSVLVPLFVGMTLEKIDGITPSEQVGEASYTSFIGKDDGKIDFHSSAREIHALVRAMNPWPKAYCMLGGEKLYITGVYGSAFDEAEPSLEEPGTVVSLVKGKGFRVATGDGYLYVTKVLPPARKEMDAAAYYNGNRAIVGTVLE